MMNIDQYFQTMPPGNIGPELLRWQDKLGVSKSTIYRWRENSRRPLYVQWSKIIQLSKGKIRKKDLENSYIKKV